MVHVSYNIAQLRNNRQTNRTNSASTYARVTAQIITPPKTYFRLADIVKYVSGFFPRGADKGFPFTYKGTRIDGAVSVPSNVNSVQVLDRFGVTWNLTMSPAVPGVNFRNVVDVEPDPNCFISQLMYKDLGVLAQSYILTHDSFRPATLESPLYNLKLFPSRAINVGYIAPGPIKFEFDCQLSEPGLIGTFHQHYIGEIHPDAFKFTPKV